MTSKTTSRQTTQENSTSSLREHVLEALERYFTTLGKTEPRDIKNFVLEEVEAAVYEAIMKFTHGNQSRAAKLMGVSRGTLRTKLKHYYSTTHIGRETLPYQF